MGKQVLSARLVSLAISIFFIVLSHSVWAVSGIKRDFNELLGLSDLVLVGTVTAMESHWSDPVAQDNINTTITLSDLQVLKGELNAEHYEVVIAGGSIPPYSVHIPGAPQFNLEKRYILFIKDNREVVFPFVGVHDGVFIVEALSQNQTQVKTLSGDIVTGIQGGEVQKVDKAHAKTFGGESLSEEHFIELVKQRLLEQSNQVSP